MLTATPTLLRPCLAAATRSSSLHKPATASAVLMLRSPMPSCPRAVTTRTFVSLPLKSSPLKRKLAPASTPATRSPATATFCRHASSSPYPSHRSQPQTGSSRNRDAAADANAAAAVAARTQATAATADAAAAAAGHPNLPPLDWNTFFQLRKTRRRVQMVFSITGGLAGGLLGGLILGSGVAEPLLTQIPLDPFLTLGLMTFGCSVLGWLAGPSLGNLVFYTWKRQYKVQMTLKETQFFARIKKNRVDPSASSASNPVPDFYGEKISSVSDYRQWLKDQRAFTKKRMTFV